MSFSWRSRYRSRVIAIGLPRMKLNVMSSRFMQGGGSTHISTDVEVMFSNINVAEIELFTFRKKHSDTFSVLLCDVSFSV